MRVTGQLREAVSSGRLSRPASITLSLKNVQSGSGRYPIETGDLTIKASSHATRNLLIIGGSAGEGAVIGGASGGGKGAAIGAAAGAGAGTLSAYLTGKREIVPPSEILPYTAYFNQHGKKQALAAPTVRCGWLSRLLHPAYARPEGRMWYS